MFEIKCLIFTENLHSEEEAGAPGQVGDHTAVLSTVLRHDSLYLQVLSPRQPLNAPTQLIGHGRERSQEKHVKKEFLLHLSASWLLPYLHLDLVLVPQDLRWGVTVCQALQGNMSINRNCQCPHVTGAQEGGRD